MMIKTLAKSIKSAKQFTKEVKSEYKAQTADVQPLQIRKSVVKGIAGTAAAVRKSGHTVRSIPSRVRQELDSME